MAGLQRKAGKRLSWLRFFRPKNPEGLQDAYGEPIDPARLFAECWGEVLPQSSREFYRAMQNFGVIDHVIEIDYLPGLTWAFTCELDGRRIYLVGALDVEERHKTHHLVAKEPVAAGV